MSGTVYVILLGVGAVITVVGVVNLVRGLASRRWPTTHGVVLVSQVAVSHDSDAEGTSRTRYKAKIVYRYMVGGQEYMGDRRSFADHSSGSSVRAYRIAEGYPEGSQVAVYYHPGKPQLCVLERGIRVSQIVSGLVGLGFIGFGAAGLLGWIG